MFKYSIIDSEMQLIFKYPFGLNNKFETEYELIHDLCIEYFQEEINIEWKDNNILNIYPVTENWKLFIDRLTLELEAI